MENKTEKLFLCAETDKFLEKFQEASTEQKSLKNGNDRTNNTALVYEKIRVALEYQEEHLVFKNAISRILRRRYTLSPVRDAKRLMNDLISELAWANYLNPEAVPEPIYREVEAVIERYLGLLETVKSGFYKKHELQKMIIDWLGNEIESILYPSDQDSILLDYAYEVLKDSLDTEGSRVTPEENEIQLKIAIYGHLFKPDLGRLQYFALNLIYKDWRKLDIERMKIVGRSFDPHYNRVDRALNHPLKMKYYTFAKRNIAPFLLLKKVLAKGVDIEKVRQTPVLLVNQIMETYQIAIEEGRSKVWRGTFRALIFILLTKISLAFILEIPFDRLLTGSIDFLSLIINISLPPTLMFFAGTFVKSPSPRNSELVSLATREMLSQARIGKKFSLVDKKPSTSFAFFNIVYTLFSLAILIAIIWVLTLLNFNLVSILLFFLFVSVVSFFSFRIRNIALELAMKRSRDDSVTTAMELIFLPFIRIGRYFSDRFNRFNPFAMVLDFLIEAPLKTIIKFTNSWLRFINNKKEELEY